jgi:hypothetical protein
LNKIKAPIPIKVKDELNFARLILALSEGNQIIWSFKRGKKNVLAFFTAYMYWIGDLPILAYVETDKQIKPFLAYKSDSIKGEEWLFVTDTDDAKYKYAFILDLKDAPEAFKKSIKGEYEAPQSPMLSEVENLNSIMRVLLAISIKEGAIFPLWHFTRRKKHVIGTCIPFEHYYEADALPVFFYTTMDEPPKAPFIKYCISKPKGEELSFSENTIDAKYFYAKIVSVEDLPFFP